MNASRQRSQRGIVLIVVLWGIVLLTLVAFTLAIAVRTGVQGIESEKEQLQAHYHARGAIYRTLDLLLAPPSGSTPGGPAGLEHQVTWNGQGWQAAVQIDDEAGKLDLNLAPEKMLARLFQVLGLDSRSAEALANATEQWRSPEADPAVAAVEDAYYLGLPRPYAPPHGPFQSVAEMLLVRGVTPDLYYGRYRVLPNGRVKHLPGLVDCLTVNSGVRAIDINSAPYPVLMAASSMDPRIADYIVQAREQKPFVSLNELTEQFPLSLASETLSDLTTQSSGRLSLLATATTSSGAMARVQAVVMLQPAHDPPFHLLTWDDNYVR